MRETRVVLGIDDTGLQEEVLHHLDRLPGVEVVGAAEGADALRRAVREHRPDVVVGGPELLSGLEEVVALAVVGRETSEGLRAAIRAGAQGFYVWPHERQALGRDIKRVRPIDPTQPEDKGVVVAVLGARGGAGTTFLATNLAAALAQRDAETVLADLDVLSGDVSPALGMEIDASLPSVLDLAAVSRELTDEHLDKVLHRHARGFHVLLAPQSVPTDARFDPATIAAAVRALRARFAVTVLHLPRSLDEAMRSAIELADQVLVVLTLDVLGIRAAKRMLDYLRSVGLGDNLRLVVNRAGRGEVVPEDAALALDAEVACVIGSDRMVERAQNRGELVVGRRRHLSRRISRLAGQLLERRAA